MSEAEPPEGEPHRGPDVGSVGEETAKLLGALSDWARDHGSDVGQGLGGLASHAAASLQDVNEHLATGSAECAYCPICRTVHAVRQSSPEVRAHLAQGASSLLQAAAGLLAAVPPPESSGRTAGVERIDLDDPEDGTSPGADR